MSPFEPSSPYGAGRIRGGTKRTKRTPRKGSQEPPARPSRRRAKPRPSHLPIDGRLSRRHRERRRTRTRPCPDGAVQSGRVPYPRVLTPVRRPVREGSAGGDRGRAVRPGAVRAAGGPVSERDARCRAQYPWPGRATALAWSPSSRAFAPWATSTLPPPLDRQRRHAADIGRRSSARGLHGHRQDAVRSGRGIARDPLSPSLTGHRRRPGRPVLARSSTGPVSAPRRANPAPGRGEPQGLPRTAPRMERRP